MAALRVITFATDVSIFALNLAVALGLALAIDYTLLLLSRFRDERAAGVPARRRTDAHHGVRRQDGVVLGDDRRSVDVDDGVVPDLRAQVVRLRRCRRGRVRFPRRRLRDTGGYRAAR